MITDGQLLARKSFITARKALRISGLVVSVFASLGLFSLPAFSESPRPALEIIKSDSDKRDYRYLELPNQLRVLLVSDPQTDKAAASLDVFVGSAQDPQDREGLAHFLEHMLFLGTEKYPEAGEYQTFISQNGGSHNAYTSGEHTNYFFDVGALQLDPALDRFSQFFVAPLFTAKYVDRERHAVNSEYKAKIKNDYRRTMDVYRQHVNPKHPMAKFSVGSLETLADREGDKVRDDLLGFYKHYYSARIMTLVVLGRESLDQLQAMVVDRFEAIPSNPMASLNHGESMFLPDFLPAQVSVQPVKDQRRLSLMFPVPAANQYYREKPMQYLGNLLGHEGEGSLLSVLKKQGWAEGLGAGAGFSDRQGATFNLTISLTEKGLAAREEIIALVFHSVEMIRQSGINQWRFGEQQQLAEIAFRFQEKSEPIHTVSGLANAMHEYEPADILRGAYALEVFDEKLIARYLSYLRRDNLFVTVSAPEIKTDRQTRRYSAPYSVVSRSDSQKTVKSGASLSALTAQLVLPEVNTFIPRKLKVKSAPMIAGTGVEKNSALPQLARKGERFRAWFKQDQEFQVPRANILVRVKSPVAASDVDGAARMHLFTALVHDTLNEFSYPASLAGLQFGIDANSRGFDISISGYNDRQGLLLTRIIEAVVKPQFKQDRFDNIKRELMRSWFNVSKQPPYTQLLKDLPVLLFSPYWSDSDMRAALEDDTLPQMKAFAGSLLNSASVDVLIHGNLYREEGIKLASLIEHQLLNTPVGKTLPKARVVKLAGEKPVLRQLSVDHRDSAVALYVQGLEDNLADEAHMLVLRQSLRAPFFHQLRTEKQLGYIVFSSAMGLKKVPGTVLVVQSPTVSSTEVVAEISGFVDRFGKELPEDLAQYQQAVIQQLLEQPKNLAEQAQRYWGNILRENYSFDRRQKLSEAVKAVSAESFTAYYQQVMQVPSRRVWLSSNELQAESLKGFNQAESHDVFKAEQPAYVYP